jgi:hypothetical protein
VTQAELEAIRVLLERRPMLDLDALIGALQAAALSVDPGGSGTTA